MTKAKSDAKTGEAENETGHRPEKHFCDRCNIIQPFRTRHCTKCDKCILKFDHHCFWIGGCVGELNHRTFWYFLFFQTVVNTWAFIIVRVTPSTLIRKGLRRIDTIHR
eukprot:TRINITY_DN6307_c0_g1_i4.p1 TRINITY_DN6307_c0_g1~~TRINITY_DN6307_c0_g1_i4.p1  ORF type:complete len:108 (+),score=5.18 TRINITY_DN6307_c0_g1_i4:520-843(+)